MCWGQLNKIQHSRLQEEREKYAFKQQRLSQAFLKSSVGAICFEPENFSNGNLQFFSLREGCRMRRLSITKNFPFYLFLDGWGGASVSAPPAGFSEDVVSTPDGGLIIKLLLEAKNATKTAKNFSGAALCPSETRRHHSR